MRNRPTWYGHHYTIHCNTLLLLSLSFYNILLEGKCTSLRPSLVQHHWMQGLVTSTSHLWRPLNHMIWLKDLHNVVIVRSKLVWMLYWITFMKLSFKGCSTSMCPAINALDIGVSWVSKYVHTFSCPKRFCTNWTNYRFLQLLPLWVLLSSVFSFDVLNRGV